MDWLEFVLRHNNVNGPEYSGAPQPEFDPAKINESRFPQELRFYEVHIHEENCRIRVDWVSQNWTWETEGFFNEVYRWFEYLLIRYEEIQGGENALRMDPAKLEVSIESRSYQDAENDFKTFEIA